MLKLRKLLSGCFGFLSVLFFMVSLSTGRALMRSWTGHAHLLGFLGVGETEQEIAAGLFTICVRLVFAMPSVLGVLYGMTWWTVRNRRPSARAWTLLTSTTVVLFSIPLTIVSYHLGLHGALGARIGQLAFNGLVIVLGVSGLFAFRAPLSLDQLPLKPARLHRIAFDGTSTFVDWVVGVLQFAGYISGSLWFFAWEKVARLPFLWGYKLWLLVVLAFLASITLHEMGHALGGMVFGMRVRAFAVGPLQWRVRDGRWTFQFHWTGILGGGGVASIVPSDPNQSRWRDVCMIAAGPLMSLLSGEIALWMVLSAKGRPWEQFWEFFAALSTICLVAFGANLIPMRPQGAYSDGARIYQLVRGGKWVDIHRAYSIITSTQVTSLRPRDFDIQSVQRALQTLTHGRQALFLKLFLISHYLDCERFNEARQALAEAEALYDHSVFEIPMEMHMGFVFNHAFLGRDKVKARQWWDRMTALKPTHLGVEYWLTQSALLWIECSPQPAYEVWQKGFALVEGLPQTGNCAFDRHRYELLGAALSQAPHGLRDRGARADGVGPREPAVTG